MKLRWRWLSTRRASRKPDEELVVVLSYTEVTDGKSVRQFSDLRMTEQDQLLRQR